MSESLLIFPLYLFYGMAFFAIGVSITSRDIRASNLRIARPLGYFALFAYSHALLEWYSLYLILYSGSFSNAALPWINLVKLSLVLVSFLFLLCFGVSLLGTAYPKRKKLIYLLPILLVAFVLFSLPVEHLNIASFPFWLTDNRIRNLIGLPSAVIAGLGFIFYSRTLKGISTKGARNFFGAGCALLAYGILTGLIPSGSYLPPGEMPVEFYRGLSAFVILHFIMNALHIFDTERRLQIEDRLLRFAKAEKLNSLGKLAFGVAHEINNPLANVSLATEMLKEDLKRSEDLNESRVKRLSSLERNLERASKIARELLFFSTDKGEDFQPTDLNELLRGSLELLGSRRKDYDIRLDLQQLESISAIPWKVEEVFLNVLSNALEAMGEGGEIQVRSSVVADRAQVIIADNGPGISAEDLPLVLDPFYTTKEVGQGTGLGLSICFGIMEMHGGNIEIESEPGQGTRVILSFPLREESDGENTDR